MADIIKELEMRVAAKRRELEDEEKALAVVRRMMGQPLAPATVGGESKPEFEQIKFEDLIGSVEKTKKRTLIDEVRDVVSRFGTNEFTVAHIEAALKKTGVAVDAKNPRARIGIALSTVLDEGLIARTAEGGGNVPHRYKLKSAVDAESDA